MAAQEFEVRPITSEKWPTAPEVAQAQSGAYFDSTDGDGGPVLLEALIQDDGSAQWWFDPDQVTLADVNRSVQHELLLASPARLYVALDEPPQGVGNGLDYWFEVIRVVPQIWNGLATVSQALAPIVTVAEAGRLLMGVIIRQRGRWSGSGGNLGAYQKLFAVARTTDQVSDLLNVAPEMVPPIANFLGLRLGPDGFWRVSNEPAAKELRELAKVADLAAHMHLRASSLRRGPLEILAFPVGERAARATGVFRQWEFRASESNEEWDPYVAGSSRGREDQFEVVKFGTDYSTILLGTIQTETDGTFSVLDPEGRPILGDGGRNCQDLWIGVSCDLLTTS